MTIDVTKQMIAEEICHHLCCMAESAEGSFELTDTFILLKNWNEKGGSLTITWKKILEGYHAYGTNHIPQFISADWDISLKIYKRLKGL